MWKVGGIKIESAAGRRFFYQGDMKIREKRKFFVNRSVPENFQWENFLGQVPTESLRTQDSENVYERWVQQILTLFCLPEVGRCR